MQQRLSIITLGVRDLKKSRAFYDALGWHVATEEQSENIVCYDLQSMALALYPLDKLAEDIQGEINPAPSGVTIAYNVDHKDDVSKVLEEAKKAGGQIVKVAQDVFWGGHSGYFSDPDGHLWEVAYNPFSPLGPNGEFQWNGLKEKETIK